MKPHIYTRLLSDEKIHMSFDLTEERIQSEYAARNKSRCRTIKAMVAKYEAEHPDGAYTVTLGSTTKGITIPVERPTIRKIRHWVDQAVKAHETDLREAEINMARLLNSDEEEENFVIRRPRNNRRNNRQGHSPSPRPGRRLFRTSALLCTEALCDDDEDEEEEEEDADGNGDLAGFVVSDHSSSSHSTPASSKHSPSTPGAQSTSGVEVVGEVTREERDAEGRANAIDLVTPPKV